MLSIPIQMPSTRRFFNTSPSSFYIRTACIPYEKQKNSFPIPHFFENSASGPFPPPTSASYSLIQPLQSTKRRATQNPEGEHAATRDWGLVRRGNEREREYTSWKWCRVVREERSRDVVVFFCREGSVWCLMILRWWMRWMSRTFKTRKDRWEVG